MKKHLVLLGVCILLVVMISGCIEQENQESKAKGEIIDEHVSTSSDVDNFIIFINLTVKNNGEDGDLNIWAYVRQGTHYDDSKSQTLFFKSGETKNVSFAFSEGFELGSSFFHDYGVN